MLILYFEFAVLEERCVNVTVFDVVKNSIGTPFLVGISVICARRSIPESVAFRTPFDIFE